MKIFQESTLKFGGIFGGMMKNIIIDLLNISCSLFIYSIPSPFKIK